jgi:UDP-N-acetylglucosamine acyltransferase
MNIHPTAIIHPKAHIDDSVEVGPYSIVCQHVTLKKGVRVGSFCVIDGKTTVGEDSELFTGAVIGSIPQDRKYCKEEETYLEIGEKNIFREYVTVNPGTGDQGKTIIGNCNLFMAYSHIAHDCIIGSDCTMANSGTLAGHVTLEDHAVIGGLAAVHQFVRVGKFSIVGGCSKVVQDIPPFSTCDGHPARVYGLNTIGLRRASFPVETIRTLKGVFKFLFFSNMTKTHAIEQIKSQHHMTPEVEHLLQFIAASSRGMCS